MREGLLQLRLGLRPAPQRRLAEDDAPRLAGGLDDARLDGVAELDEELPLAVAQLEDVDHPLGLGAEVDEHRLVADGDHPPFDHLADLRVAAARRGRVILFELGEHRAEVVVFGFRHGA